MKHGGWGAYGGGAFSGKVSSKDDHRIVKSLVANNLCCHLVQLLYAIVVGKPLSVYVEEEIEQNMHQRFNSLTGASFVFLG